MDLKEYLDRYHIDVETFALKCKLCPSTIYQYLKGKRPYKKNAWKIEKITGGNVTAKQMLGDNNG